MNNTTQQLIQIGLSEKEAKVYTSMLSVGMMSISQIARKAEIKRPTAYHVIDSLLQKNLIQKIPKRKKMLYRAYPPSQIGTYLDQKKITFEKILPDLNESFRRPTKAPKISYYENAQGIEEVWDKCLDTSATVYGVFSGDDILSIVSEEKCMESLEKIRRKGGYLYNMVQDSDTAQRYKNHPSFQGISKNKILPKSFQVPADLMVSGKLTSIVSYQNKTGVLIDDESIALLMRQLLRNLWKST